MSEQNSLTQEKHVSFPPALEVELVPMVSPAAQDSPSPSPGEEVFPLQQFHTSRSHLLMKPSASFLLSLQFKVAFVLFPAVHR